MGKILYLDLYYINGRTYTHELGNRTAKEAIALRANLSNIIGKEVYLEVNTSSVELEGRDGVFYNTLILRGANIDAINIYFS
jgi:hypothetical protein